MIEIPSFINVDLDEPVPIDPDQAELLAEDAVLQMWEVRIGK